MFGMLVNVISGTYYFFMECFVRIVRYIEKKKSYEQESNFLLCLINTKKREKSAMSIFT